MKNNLGNMLKKELRDMFRDKKSLAMMLVIPIFIPLLVIGMSTLFEMQMTQDPSEYNLIGFDYELSEVENNIIQELNINPIIGTEEELKQKFDNNEIYLYVLKDDNNYTINGDDSEATTYASMLVESYFNSYKNYLQNEYLTDKNINSDEVINIINLKENIVKQDSYFANYIINYAFLFIIMAITVSATYPATDTTAG